MEHVEQKTRPARTWHNREKQDEDSRSHQGKPCQLPFPFDVFNSVTGCLRIGLWQFRVGEFFHGRYLHVEHAIRCPS